MSEIILVGDIAFNGIISSEPERNKERYAKIVPLLNNTDRLVFANLEVPVKANGERNEFKRIIHYSDSKITEHILRLLNVSCVSLANNHIYDCKMSGLKATINLLDELGIYHTGAGWKEEHIEPIVFVKDKMEVGFIAYVDKSTNPKTEFYPELLINYFDVGNVKQQIAELRPKVDKIICSIHWGVDYSCYPTPDQVKIARELVDSGADIIMGHHPHTLQPYEKYSGSYIFYSLGTFIFGDIHREKGLSSLPLKTKKSIIVCYNSVKNNFYFQGIRLNKLGYVSTLNFDFDKWSKRTLFLNNLRIRFYIINWLIIFKESYFDRLSDLLFGYYRNPVKSIFSSKLLKRIQNIQNEFKRLMRIN